MIVNFSTSIRNMWGDNMGEIIGRTVSRKTALDTLKASAQYIPNDRIDAYVAALNRVAYEFRRHEPVETNGSRCGQCGATIMTATCNYCWNCGREIKR